MVTPIGPPRPIVNGTANDATPVAANFTDSYNNDVAIANALAAAITSLNSTIATEASNRFVQDLLNYGTNQPPVYVDATHFSVNAFNVIDSTGMIRIRKSTSITVNLAATGAAGIDDGVLTSADYYLYAISDGQNTTPNLMVSRVNEVVTGTIALPTGYANKRQLPFSFHCNGSGMDRPWSGVSGWNTPTPEVHLAQDSAAFITTAAASSTQVVAANVPPVSRRAKFTFYSGVNSGTSTQHWLADGNNSGFEHFIGISNSSIRSANSGIVVGLDSSQRLYHRSDNTANNFQVWTTGFYVTEVPW